MLKREYIFETAKTRNRRTLFNLTLALLVGALGLGILIYTIPYYGLFLSESGQGHYYEKSPDLIAVYTGDSGRIELALETSLQHPSSKLLISGVYSKNNLFTLLRQAYPDKQDDMEYFSSIIELDYKSQNTIDNVLMTIKFLRQSINYRDILVISSDYHLPRIKMIFDLFQETEDDFNIQYMGVNNPIWEKRSFMLYSKELMKMFKAILYKVWPVEE
jgi:hypothetical protein